MFTSLRQLFSHLSVRRRWQLAGLVLLMVVGAVAEMATLGAVVPFLALLVDPDSVNRYPALLRLLGQEGAERHGILRWAAVLFAVIAMAAAGLRMLLFWASYRFTFGLGADIGGELYRRTLYRPYSWHVARNSSEILAAIEKVNSVTNSVIVQLVQGGVALLMAVAILATLLAIDAKIALIAGSVFSCLYGLTTLVSRPRLRRNAKSIAKNRTKRVQSVQEGLGGIRDVLLDGTQPIYHRRFAKFDNEMRRAQAGNAFIGASPRVFMEAAGVVLIMLLAYGLSGQQGGLAQAVPILGALALGAQKLLPQMQQVYHAWSAITGSRAELDDVLSLLEAPIAPEYTAMPAQSSQAILMPQTGQPLVALRRVSFRYHPDAPQVLHSIDLEIPRGMRIGIVGTTGSGKSTLIDLIMGLLQPCQGRIEIEGQTLHAQNLRAWQDRIAHVPQSIHLIDASIAENIALGTPPERIDWNRVEEAARKAQLEEFLATLPQQYQTTVGERGVRLSGGQRQRIGLARALYKRADVLVLDEATSALDNQTEQEIIGALDKLHGEKTVLMIAHRLSTIQNCDRIVVISNGVIAGCGDWNALVASNPAFQSIAASVNALNREFDRSVLP
jgi:ABC-type multidrug transport system fused ATPase/permease subunit